jgi:hypothetical protein
MTRKPDELSDEELMVLYQQGEETAFSLLPPPSSLLPPPSSILDTRVGSMDICVSGSMTRKRPTTSFKRPF